METKFLVLCGKLSSRAREVWGRQDFSLSTSLTIPHSLTILQSCNLKCLGPDSACVVTWLGFALLGLAYFGLAWLGLAWLGFGCAWKGSRAGCEGERV
ncbi:hypothetical protein E2C01_068749 [Portunus trituberculatus]|uniref:Uncharacterized protein n=1 Tax=Portunus trituberculatus TaxID=210409 RepID=A0A5B7HN75_PORTR|nr:hypothetical protein [Portunus trituberculatus]